MSLVLASSLPRELEEAVDWARFPRLRDVVAAWIERVPMPYSRYIELADVFKETAVSAMVTWNEVEAARFQKLIERALGDGLTVKEFRLLADEAFDSAWYADMVYRTNVAQAQAAGRYSEMFGADTDIFPFWQFQAIEDDRNDTIEKCPHLICRSLDGHVFSKRDGSANRYLPPVHYSCRCMALDVLDDYTGTVSKGSAMGIPLMAGWDYDRLEAIGI